MRTQIWRYSSAQVGSHIRIGVDPHSFVLFQQAFQDYIGYNGGTIMMIAGQVDIFNLIKWDRIGQFHFSLQLYCKSAVGTKREGNRKSIHISLI
jgi:hypothetical protein